MTAETERKLETFLRQEEEARRREGLEKMVKDLNATIERTNKNLASFKIDPAKK